MILQIRLLSLQITQGKPGNLQSTAILLNGIMPPLIKPEPGEFVSDKEKITIKFPLTTLSYDILKLRENELWLKDAEEELHLIPAN